MAILSVSLLGSNGDFAAEGGSPNTMEMENTRRMIPPEIWKDIREIPIASSSNSPATPKKIRMRNGRRMKVRTCDT